MPRKNLFFVLLVFVIAVSFAISQEAPKSGEAEEAVITYPPQAIIVAAYRGDEKMVREILAAGVDKNARDSIGATALHVAVFQSNPMVIRLLLEYGFDPNARTSRNGYTPLHNAVSANNVEAARLLLRYGADPNIRGLDGLSPLAKARMEEKRQLVLLLY